MRAPVRAGVDVGNATTEVVIGRVHGGAVEVLAAGRAPTRGRKGSAASLDGAAALVARLERRHGVAVEEAVVAPLRPVHTLTATVPEEATRTGRLRVLARDAGTSGGAGLGAGRPHPLGAPPPSGDEPLVAVVGPDIGFREAADRLAALAGSRELAAVVLANDEAVLVANRLPASICGSVPVVDEVDTAAALRAQRLVVEVAADGRPLQALTDPLRLGALLGLGDEDRPGVTAVARGLLDAANAVVALATGDDDEGAAGSRGWVELAGRRRVAFPVAAGEVRAGPVGLATAYALPDDTGGTGGTGGEHRVEDLWLVDLAAVAEQVAARRPGTAHRPVGLAALRADAPYADPSEPLAARLGRPVRCVASEAGAARAGALTTPGAGPGTAVVDLGGGTIDTVSAGPAVVAAGGGDLLTAAVAALTGVTPAAAEWVKRGPAHRVEAPQVLLSEDGRRSFLDRPAPADVVGRLVVSGPAGLLPFHRTLAPGEWRALRLRLKVELVGGNIARALRTLDERPSTVVVVGGPAGDDEVLAAVGGALPSGTAIGRGDVAGCLGHRYAVACGLLLTA